MTSLFVRLHAALAPLFPELSAAATRVRVDQLDHMEGIGASNLLASLRVLREVDALRHAQQVLQGHGISAVAVRDSVGGLELSIRTRAGAAVKHAADVRKLLNAPELQVHEDGDMRVIVYLPPAAPR